MRERRGKSGGGCSPWSDCDTGESLGRSEGSGESIGKFQLNTEQGGAKVACQRSSMSHGKGHNPCCGGNGLGEAHGACDPGANVLVNSENSGWTASQFHSLGFDWSILVATTNSLILVVLWAFQSSESLSPEVDSDWYKSALWVCVGNWRRKSYLLEET